MEPTRCARCDHPITPGADLACPRCSRALGRRSLPPASISSIAPPSLRSGSRTAAELDRALARVEAEHGLVTRIVVEVEGTLGRDLDVRVSAGVLDRRELEPLVVDHDSSLRERDERIAWARRLTSRRELAPLTVRERYRLGDRLSSGGAGWSMLLLARLARAQLAFAQAEGHRFHPRSVQIEDEGGVVRCLAELADDAGLRFVVVELATVPADDSTALAELCRFVDGFAALVAA